MVKQQQQPTINIFFVIPLVLFTCFYISELYRATQVNLRTYPPNNNFIDDEDLIIYNVMKEYRKNSSSYEQLAKTQLFFCGALCNFDTTYNYREDLKWTNFDLNVLVDAYVHVPNVNCDLLFSEEAQEVLEAKPIEWPPPKELPLRSLFTLGNRIPVKEWYHTNKYLGATTAVWTKELIQQHLDDFKNNKLHGTYGIKGTYYLAYILEEVGVKNKNILVVGSEKPWIEVILIHLGAGSITTLDYGQITNEDERLVTFTPSEFNKMYILGVLPEFDMVVSFSSIEHSGLGRYGDGINPWGDIITIGKMSCVVKHGGEMILGLPSNVTDSIVYNAHRVYGPMRWPLVLTNWYPLKIWKDHHDTYKHRIVYARNDLP